MLFRVLFRFSNLENTYFPILEYQLRVMQESDLCRHCVSIFCFSISNKHQLFFCTELFRPCIGSDVHQYPITDWEINFKIRNCVPNTKKWPPQKGEGYFFLTLIKICEDKKEICSLKNFTSPHLGAVIRVRGIPQYKRKVEASWKSITKKPKKPKRFSG